MLWLRMSNSKSTDPRLGGFSFGKLSDEFDDEFTNTVRTLCDTERAKVIPPENVAHYSHGQTWLELKPAGDAVHSTFEEHSLEYGLPLGDIRSHRVKVIPEHVTSVVKGMTKQLMQMLYAKVGEGAEAVGNVVDAKEFGSPALAFLEGLKRVQFGVDRAGNPSRPNMHLGKEAFEAFRRDAEKRGQAFQDKVDEITKQKEREAVERNKARLSRFKGLKGA